MSTYHLREGETIIRIEHGDLGYHMASPTLKSDEDIRDINKFNGVTMAQCEAAKLCSMMNCWDNFEKLATDAFK